MHFEIWFFLVVPLYKEAHEIMCIIWTKMEDMCSNMFHKYWNKGHFMMRNDMYVYKEGDISLEEIYMKKQLVTFIKELDHIGVVTHCDESSNKYLT